MSLNFFTIGVYGTTEESFFNKLLSNKVDTFCDIRNRRGVRGAKYSYVNSKRLQAKLNELGIKYLYVPDLAPTPEIRNIQKQADKKDSILKSKREELSPLFKNEFTAKVLEKFDFNSFLEVLVKQGATNVVLFCVEAEAKACHRSLVIQKIHNDFRYSINHI
jgi:uncharacterized protein (DUF488 family)